MAQSGTWLGTPGKYQQFYFYLEVHKEVLGGQPPTSLSSSVTASEGVQYRVGREHMIEQYFQEIIHYDKLPDKSHWKTVLILFLPHLPYTYYSSVETMVYTSHLIYIFRSKKSPCKNL